jgi:hypothetical protein
LKTWTEEEVDRMVEVLNEVVRADRHAAQELMASFAVCNGVLKDHPTVQVVQAGPGHHLWPEGQVRIGLLGVINGIAGCIEDPSGRRSGWGRIGADYVEGKLTGFRRVTADPEITPDATRNY